MRWIGAIWRALVSSIGLVTWVLPASMAVLCGAYLYDCIERVRAPGFPVKFVYTSGSGEKVAIRAESYAFDPNSLTLHVFGVRVDGAAGDTAVKAQALRIVYKDGRWIIYCSGVRGQVERLAEGKFSFERFLPEQRKTKGETAFSVIARDVVIDYVDRSASPSLRTQVGAPRFRVDGSGPNVIAYGDIELASLGRVPLRVSALPDLVEVRTKLAGSDLAPLLPHARRWLDPKWLKDWSPADAQKLDVTGPIRIAVRPKDHLLIDGDLRIAASGVRVTDLVARGDAKLTAQFDASRARVKGSVVELGRQVDFEGVVGYSDRFVLAGQATASARTQSDLWLPLRKALPRDLRFGSAAWKGAIAWDGTAFSARGSLTASSVLWQGESIRNAESRLAVDGKRLAIQVDKGKWQDIPVAGALQWDFASKKLSGWAKSGATDLAALAAKFEGKDLSGTVRLQAVLSGTTAAPRVALAAQGQASYTPKDKDGRYLGLFDARGRLDAKTLTVDRFALTGSGGLFSGFGSMDLKKRVLAGTITGGGIDLSQVFPELSGEAFAVAKLSGTVAKPVLDGDVELYGAKHRDYDQYEIPVATAHLKVDHDGLLAEGIHASIGATDANGSLSWKFESGQLAGEVSARRITLSDWLGEDVEGVASLDAATISGTIDRPSMQATAKLVGVRAFGFDAEAADLDLHIDKDRADVSRGHVTFGPDQTADFTGAYVFDLKKGSARGTFKGIPLDHIPESMEEVEIGGSANGSFDLEADEHGVTTLTSELQVDELLLNKNSLGVGTASISKANGVWNGTAQVGEPGRYILIPNATYAEANEALSAELTSYHFPIESVVNAFKKSYSELSPNLQQLIAGIQGNLSGTAKLSGPLKNPDLVLDGIAAEGLSIAGRSAGIISLAGSRSGGNWDVKSFTWNEGKPGEPKAVLSASGTVAEQGDLSVRGDLQNFDLTWLSNFNPSMPPLVGKAGFAFVMGGPTSSPNLLESSLTTDGLGYLGADGKPETLPVNVLLSDLTVIDGVLAANGFLSFLDFSGKIEAKIPVKSFVQSDQDSSEHGRVTLTANPRDIVDLDETFSWLDTKRSTGKLGGSVEFEGVPGDYRLTATLITDGQIAAKGMDTFLKGFQFDAAYRDRVLSFGGNTASSFGGTIEADGTVKLADVPSGRFDLSDWLAECQLLGSIQAKGFTLIQNPNSKSNRMEATVKGALALNGNLLEPRISGIPNEPILFGGVNATIPSEFASKPAAAAPLINPRFDRIALLLDGDARVRTSTSDLRLGGRGLISGTLQYPNLTADLVVDKGTFRLPTNRVELEPGGTLAFSYNTGPYVDPKARLDVKLEGRTSVSARRFGDTIERYEISLDLRGDLLQDGGVTIAAPSDPPDLSQDQILSILGQRDLIESFARATLAPGNSAAREAVLGYFLPSITTPLTEGLASGLNLDYVSIEYNPFDQTTITAAKTFAKGFTLIARRQLNTLPGQKPRYELKLTYRPPFRNLIIGRSRFGIGIDQDRPWKVTFEYGIRF